MSGTREFDREPTFGDSLTRGTAPEQAVVATSADTPTRTSRATILLAMHTFDAYRTGQVAVNPATHVCPVLGARSATSSRVQIDEVGRIRLRPAREAAGVPIWAVDASIAATFGALFCARAGARGRQGRCSRVSL